MLVSAYDPRWPDWFRLLAERLRGQLGGHALAIEHVGSTAVPGLVAKPIIDIDVAIDRARSWPAVVAGLGGLGYRQRGDLGIAGRESFALDAALAADLPLHHLYVCDLRNEELRRHLAFRDRLRSRPDEAARLGALKLAVAARCGADREAYVTGKAALVREILARALQDPPPVG